MSETQHFKHIIEAAKHGVDGMKPLKNRKDPVLAAVMGFFLGPLGIGLYFQSLGDFFLCLGVLIALTIFIPGLGLVPGYLFAPAYGIYRAVKSNESH